MHKLWWSGCKRFTSGHGIAGTVSGVEAAIHCGDELWFGVGMEASPLNQRSLPLATVKPTLKQRRLQRCTAKTTPVFSIVFPILCAVTSVVEIRPPLPTVQGTLQQSSGGETGPLSLEARLEIYKSGNAGV